MGFKCGIVGLPNVGKSTLFNALTETAAAQAANYPFCTIEPNVGDVAVPEPRLDALAEIAASKEIIPARVNFVDVAGLVRGASKGEGLGNQFLANIRDCDAIAFVARCFEDDDITHVEGRVDPLADLDTQVEAARLLCLQALWLKDRGLPHSAEAAMCKWWAPKLAYDAIHQCLLSFGHGGYDRGPMEQRLRDVLGFQIGDGTAQIMKTIIARSRAGREAVPA